MKLFENRSPFNGARFTRRIILVLVDIAAFVLSSIAALWLRLEFTTHSLTQFPLFWNMIKLLPATVILAILIFAVFGLYNSLWEYAGEREVMSVFLASFVATAAQTALHYITRLYVPRSFWPINFVVLSAIVLTSRFSYRYIRRKVRLYQKTKSNSAGEKVSKLPKKRTMIIGAGSAGVTTLEELRESNFSQNNVICFIDDDKQKQGKFIHGVPIFGSRDRIEEAVARYGIEEIIFAIPSASAKVKADILDICNKTSCRLRTLPGIYQLVNGEVDVKKIRDVNIEDLLFRETVKLDFDETRRSYAGKTVLVTGGGGSIGSELCRQIASCSPKKLVILDIYENNAYDIQQELIRNYKDKLDLSVEIGSVRDRICLEYIFAKYRPDIVFHAAAHKHVPLMENSPCEAIKNNVFGTYNTADMAEKYGVSKFILISTDKAVNPTNIMGASKRLCEMIVQCRHDSNTNFAAVRFGNVLGSNGSVIPLFRRQIESGGPVTITDKRIIRYFMTIPEASQLVMEAGAMAEKGELFVLDMGKPVKIYDLAINMIKLSGLEPDVDIEVKEIGLRPGEKLYEELLIKSETLDKTKNDMIFVEKDASLSREDVEDKLSVLRNALDEYKQSHDKLTVKNAMKQTVPRFKDPEEINKNSENSEEMKRVAGK
ncbi:MAG: polysaccharide biosynthesis protein [Ruminococcaceae bacterium]|nr:polysaccharide biosynthesis protein [Oscillospiraceae bacterium]